MSAGKLTYVEMQGFKCFSNLRLGLGALTLLTGFNAGGKSTAMQPLLLLSQGLRLGEGMAGLPLNGPIVRLGTAGDVTSESASTIKFAVATESEKLSIEVVPRAGDRFLTVSDSSWLSAKEVTEVLRTLMFIGAVRFGAADAFPIPDVTARTDIDVGVDGRFAPYWYDQLVDDEIDELRCNAQEPARTFRKQIDAWLSTLFPRAQTNVQHIAAASQMCLQFRLSDRSGWHRPANIGYGLTYAFPILVALLGARPGQILFVDSPEAHLHPFAQSQMGRLLTAFARAGVQIIVETHSDHLLNGVRLAVKEQILDARDVALHFFSGPEPDGHGVASPNLQSDGSVYEWPSGFFDQGEKDLALLAGWD